MKNLKRRILIPFFSLIIVAASMLPAGAANIQNPPKTDDVSVKIVSPVLIKAKPVHDCNIAISITNNTDKTINDCACYLTVVDVGRKQTYPVDEFGENAYQTREVNNLAPHKSIQIKIPVKILYVGNFRFTASVISYGENVIYSAKALDVNIISDSAINKPFVIVSATAVPVVLLVVLAAVSVKRSKARRKTSENI